MSSKKLDYYNYSSYQMRPSKGAFMSITCNIIEPSILQVIGVSKLNNSMSRVFLSDGSVYMCAQTQSTKIQNFEPYCFVQITLRFKGIGTPLEIISIDKVLEDPKVVVGDPIPYLDFMKNGFKQVKTQSIFMEQEAIEDETTIAKIKKAPEPIINVMVQEVSPIQHHPSIQSIQQSILLNEPQAESNQKTIPFAAEKYKSIINSCVTYDVLYPGLRGWKIIGRVIWKDVKQITTKNRQGGQVEVMNFMIINQQSETQACSAFGDASKKWAQFIMKGQVYEFSEGKIIGPNYKNPCLSVQFTTNSKIFHIQENQWTRETFPCHSFKLTPIDKLIGSSLDQEYDVGGIIKVILNKEITQNNKLNVKLVLVDPTIGKQIDVLLNMKPDLYQSFQENIIAIFTNLKIAKAQDGTISLRSGFKTDIITTFHDDQEQIQEFKPFLESLRLTKIEFSSMSQSYYKPRTLRQHLDTIQIAPPEIKIYSKINLIFFKPSESNRSFYEGCYKCSKKIYKNPTRKSNYCSNYTCRKIVDSIPHYCLRLIFINNNNSIELTLFKENAKNFIEMSAEEYFAMSVENQNKHLSSLRLKQLSICIYSSKTIGGPVHQVYSVSEPEVKLQLDLITQMINQYPTCVKQEYEWESSS